MNKDSQSHSEKPQMGSDVEVTNQKDDHVETMESNETSVTDLKTTEDFQKLEAELAEAKDKYLRLYAEFENFRRRTAKEKSELIYTANEQLMVSLLSVLDDVERSKSAIEQSDDIKMVVEGVELVYSKFKKTLESKGLKELTSKGMPFNPDVHEAITQIPAASEEMKGKVVDEIEKGYYLHEKLIRVAKVVVGT